MESIIDTYLDSIWIAKGLSKHSLDAYGSDLKQFSTWLHTQRQCDLAQATSSDIQDYLSYLIHLNYKTRSTSRLTSCLRGFYLWMKQQGRINENPMQNIQHAKLTSLLPKGLSEDEVSRLLLEPKVDIAIECRDKAMLELLYSCGLRVTELITLRVNQVNLRQEALRIVGKGSRERMIPIGSNASQWIRYYLEKARSELLSSQSDVLFPSKRGHCMSRQTFWYRIKHYACLLYTSPSPRDA